MTDKLQQIAEKAAERIDSECHSHQRDEIAAIIRAAISDAVGATGAIEALEIAVEHMPLNIRSHRKIKEMQRALTALRKLRTT